MTGAGRSVRGFAATAGSAVAISNPAANTTNARAVMSHRGRSDLARSRGGRCTWRACMMSSIVAMALRAAAPT
jgi:hypothetical protein